ncbi:hypothetical protein Pelo_16048 [Pelomyxa schiedti]|nr:hypothetical protein Pelo_16048 [Pelomyxa schiedti]
MQPLLTSFFTVVSDGSAGTKLALAKSIDDVWAAENRRLEKEAEEHEKRELDQIVAEVERVRAVKTRNVCERVRKDEEWREKRREDLRRRQEGQGREIVPGLYLGNEASASNFSWLANEGITHILNCTKEVPCFYAPKGRVAPGEASSEDENDDAEDKLKCDVAPNVIDTPNPTGSTTSTTNSELPPPSSSDEVGKVKSDSEQATSSTSPSKVKEKLKSFLANQCDLGHESEDNCDSEEDVNDSGKIKIVYHRIPVEDAAHCRIFHLFPESNTFISSAVAGGGKVLVHCKEGRSRSAAFAVAYLMNSSGISLQESRDMVDTKCWTSNINPGFELELSKYELKLFPDKGETSVHKDKSERSGRSNAVDLITAEVDAETDSSRKRSPATVNSSSPKSKRRRLVRHNLKDDTAKPIPSPLCEEAEETCPNSADVEPTRTLSTLKAEVPVTSTKDIAPEPQPVSTTTMTTTPSQTPQSKEESSTMETCKATTTNLANTAEQKPEVKTPEEPIPKPTENPKTTKDKTPAKPTKVSKHVKKPKQKPVEAQVVEQPKPIEATTPQKAEIPQTTATSKELSPPKQSPGKRPKQAVLDKWFVLKKT